jgi:ribosomal protein S18 acetylase RimI-like enzyme
MVETVIAIRAARSGDALGISRVHDDAWRQAYRGIIPGAALERMVQRRGPAWWARAIRMGTRLLVIECRDDLAGYASLGRSRVPALGYRGEIFELYLAPEYQGAGFGRRLFDSARKDLASFGCREFVVWALADNQRAIEFYERMGGKVVKRAVETFDSEVRTRIAFGFQ